MQIKVNGDDFAMNESMTIRQLLVLLKLEEQRIAIEVNEEIIPKSEHDNHYLSEGDKIEIVRAIGGGNLD